MRALRSCRAVGGGSPAASSACSARSTPLSSPALVHKVNATPVAAPLTTTPCVASTPADHESLAPKKQEVIHTFRRCKRGAFPSPFELKDPSAGADTSDTATDVTSFRARFAQDRAAAQPERNEIMRARADACNALSFWGTATRGHGAGVTGDTTSPPSQPSSASASSAFASQPLS